MTPGAYNPPRPLRHQFPGMDADGFGAFRLPICARGFFVVKQRRRFDGISSCGLSVMDGTGRDDPARLRRRNSKLEPDRKKKKNRI